MDIEYAKEVLRDEREESSMPYCTFLGVPITEDNFTKTELITLHNHAYESGKIAGRLEILHDPILFRR